MSESRPNPHDNPYGAAAPPGAPYRAGPYGSGPVGGPAQYDQRGYPPVKKGSALKVILIVMGVLLLLACAAGTALVLLVKDKVEETVNTRVSAPAMLGKLSKSTDNELQAWLGAPSQTKPGVSGQARSTAASKTSPW